MSRVPPGGGPVLTHKVWDPTPWVVDVYEGDLGKDNYRSDMQKIIAWCLDNIGEESSPIHGHPGKWHRAGFSINGWTWIGFDSKEHMTMFLEAWPDNSKGP